MIDQIIIPRTHDIGNFEVRRALPSRQKRMVGPFIFWDEMGPGEFLTGQGVDVRPHPHIGLSTLTYLFDGELMHRDSLGVNQTIRPGDVNLMTAGRGIVHSERTGQNTRNNPHRLHGIQSWLALPIAYEDGNPDFTHIAKDDFPIIHEREFDMRLIAGNLFGRKSPFQFPHDTLYADMRLRAGCKFSIPTDAEELAVYPLSGKIKIGDSIYDPMQLLVLHSKSNTTIHAQTDCHLMIFGGAVMDAPRHIWWNFVSSSKSRLEQAKDDWKNGRFPIVPGETEFIPLPE